MNHTQVYLNHQIVFVSLVMLACALPLDYFLSFSNLQIFLSLILFFGLGIPHGALDTSLGKKLFYPRFGSRWIIAFVLVYLLCVGLIVGCWMLFPLPSFLFFLGISAFHFGFSDRLYSKGTKGFLEGVARGFLPITLPAYFYPQLFQELVESSLPESQALIVLNIVRFFFYPGLTLLLVLIIEGFLRKDKPAFMNSLELSALLVLFLSLKPFPAFLIYFCFLHSFRHILHVLEERKQIFNRASVKWLIVQALPATVTTLLTLAAFYLLLEHEAIDVPVMLNLFFISLAALTFPHMILVEAAKK